MNEIDKTETSNQKYTIRLKDIPESGLERTFTDQDAPLISALTEKGLSSAHPFHTHLSMDRIKKLVRVKGRIQATLKIACARCGEEFLFPLDHPFNAEFCFDEAVRRNIEQEIDLEKKDLGISFLSTNALSVVDVIGEQLILETPMKPLCSQECKGRCSKCGQNLNERHCGCTKGGAKGSFDVLKTIIA